MVAGTGGLVNAPVTKGLLVTSTFCSLAWQATKTSVDSPPAVLRAFAKLCAFNNVGELIFGAYLLYYFRVIERQSGSTRFGSFAFLVSTLSWGLQMSLHLAYGWQKTLTSGPYGVIFASFVPFIFDIPPSFRFTVLGMNFSDKTLAYVGGLQLAVSSGFTSLVAAFCGLIAGLAYRSNLFGMGKFMMPRGICKFVKNTIGRLLDGSRSGAQVRTYTAPNQAYEAGNAVFGPGASRPNLYQDVARVEVSAAALQQLVSMGFGEAASRRALEATANDVQAAISTLVERGGSN